jgi:hypothetical protein
MQYEIELALLYAKNVFWRMLRSMPVSKVGPQNQVVGLHRRQRTAGATLRKRSGKKIQQAALDDQRQAPSTILIIRT